MVMIPMVATYSYASARSDGTGGARRARRHLVYAAPLLDFWNSWPMWSLRGITAPPKHLWRGAKGAPGLPVAHRPGARPEESAAGMAKNGYVVKIAG